LHRFGGWSCEHTSFWGSGGEGLPLGVVGWLGGALA